MLGSDTSERQAIVRQHRRWGVLPPQTHGKGLVFLLLSVVPPITVFIVAGFDGWPPWAAAPQLLAVGGIIASTRHTNRWINDQVAAVQAAADTTSNTADRDS